MPTVAGTAELLGVCAAADAIGCHASTISRYLKDFPDLNQGSKGRPKIDVAALRRHRAQHTNPTPRGHQAGKVLVDGGPPPIVAADAPPAATKVADSPNYALAKAVRETVLAQRARVDLDEKRGLLVPRQEIEDAVYDAGAVLQRDLLELGAQLAERLAAMDKPREIAALLETEHRRVLATLATSLRAKAESRQAEEQARVAAQV